MTGRHRRHGGSLIVWTLSVCLLPAPIVAQEKPAKKTEARPGAPVAAFDYRAEAIACLKEAYETALKYPDAVDTARAVVAIADAAWRIDKKYASSLFVRAIEIAHGEVLRTNARDLRAIEARADAVNGFARRDGPGATLALQGLAARGFETATVSDKMSPEEREARAALFCIAAYNLAAVDPGTVARLARQSLELGVLPRGLGDVLGVLRDPLAGQELMRRALRVAAADERLTLDRLLDFGTKTFLVIQPGKTFSDVPQEWMWRTFGLRTDWERIAYGYLNRAADELLVAAREGRPSKVPMSEFALVGANPTAFRWTLEKLRPDRREVVQLAIARALHGDVAPLESDIADAREFELAIKGTPGEVLEAAARVRDAMLADALRLIAADRALREVEDEKARERIVHKALETTQDDRRRECAEAHVLIARAYRDAGAGKWNEAARWAARIARPELRAQLAGSLALLAAKSRRADEVAIFATAAKKASDVAIRSPRTVQGLWRAAVARDVVGDGEGAVAALSDALFVFDRMTADDEPPPNIGRAQNLITVHEVSPYMPVDREKPESWPVARALSAVVARDPLGARFVAASLKTAERRVEALTRLAGVLALRARKERERERKLRRRREVPVAASPEISDGRAAGTAGGQ